MASNINTSSLDENYPIAGRDNDTQGFRDNFGIIKNNFLAAKSEIEDLQDNAARKDDDNNFQGSQIINADLRQTTEFMTDSGNSAFAEGVISATISFANGHYHRYNLDLDSATVSFNLVGWPTVNASNRYAKMTVELYNIRNGSKSVTWTSNNSTGGLSTFKRSENWPTTFLVAGTSSAQIITPVIVEFWTYDGGNTVYANYLGTFADV